MNLYFPGAARLLFLNFWFVFVEVFLERQKDDHIMDLEGANVRFESQNYHIYLLVVERQFSAAFWWLWEGCIHQPWASTQTPPPFTESKHPVICKMFALGA